MTDDFLAGLPGFHRPYYLDPATGADDYPAEFLTLTPLLAGYVHYGETDVPGSPAGFYMSGARHRYDIHDVSGIPRGQVRASRDPLGAESRIDYDEHDLFPIRVTDAAGLSSYGSYDYRVLQAREAIDANGNSARVRFSPAGFVTEQFRCGKNGEGDAAVPSIRMEYDLLAFTRRGQPVSVRSILRVHHDAQTDVPADRRDEVIMAVEYSDGFGRSLQTRAQADDTVLGDPVFDGSMIPADQALPGWPSMGRTRPPGAADNVVASGWQIYDNKGRAVVTYEPFFATGFDYAPPVAAQLGQKATMSYDPRGQVIRTTNPDGSQQRVVFGVPVDLSDPDLFAPTPWEAFTYDANDNAGRTHGEAAATYRDHWDTPASVVFDALGRTVTAVARNGPVPDTDWFVTRSTYDIKGNLVAITDALGREAFRYAVDLVGRRWRVDGIDAGRRDTVTDALGRTVEGRDSKGALTLNAFDVLHRPIRVWARDDGSGPVTLRQRLDYGDGGDPNQPAAERNAARADNLLGLAVRHYDEAGLVTVARVDFKGNVVDATRRVIADASIVAAYELAAANGWQVTPFQVDWASGDGLLETTVYATTTAYDALNRISRLMLPRDVEGLRRTLHPTYNRAGGLVRVLLDDTVYLERIAYNAKGQRALVAYGNGVMTRYVYDPRTFRLARIRSEHYTVAGGDYQPSGEVIHDCGYSYDLAGNILAIHDRAPGSGIRANPGAFTSTDPILGSLLSTGDALERRFAYDPLYRLLSATGRECDASPVSDPWLDLPRCTDATRSRPYTESYVYDRTGSLLQLTHAAAAGFTRNFAVGSTSNRLVRMLVGATPFDYAFDANGNLRSESTSRHFAWNHADRLKAFATQTAGAEPSIHAHYLYDAAGIRVKKLVRRQGGGIEVTHYVGAMFEHHRWSGGSNSHVHVMDDSQRIAIVRIGPAHPSSLGPPIQFHLADHLGCSSAVIDDTGALTNREEFTPYGETSFGSFERKRFRFTGKERDEESGLNYHGARYLSPTLGRWFSCDPVVSAAGSSLYTYVNNRPLVRCDPTGNDEEDPKTTGGSAPKSERVSNPAGHNYGPTFWEAYSSGGRGRSGNLRYNALGPNQTFVRELMDKQWGCTLCHVSTVVWNEHGPKAFNSDNQLPVDSFIDRDGFASLVARSVVTRALTESFVGAVGLTQGMWATAGPVVQDIGNTAARTPAFDAPAPAPTGAPRPAFDVTMGDVKAIGDKKGLRHLSEMEGRGKYNDTGQTALVYYDREGGVVSTQIFSQRPPGGGPRTIVFEGTIGRVDIPAGLTPIQIGSRVEEPVRRVFSEWIGYEYPTKSPNAHGPDLHKPRGGQPTAPAPPRRGR